MPIAGHDTVIWAREVGTYHRIGDPGVNALPKRSIPYALVEDIVCHRRPQAVACDGFRAADGLHARMSSNEQPFSLKHSVTVTTLAVPRTPC